MIYTDWKLRNKYVHTFESGAIQNGDMKNYEKTCSNLYKVFMFII